MCTKFHAYNTSMVVFKKSKKDKKNEVWAVYSSEFETGWLHV